MGVKIKHGFPYTQGHNIRLAADTLNTLAQIGSRFETWDETVSRVLDDWVEIKKYIVFGTPSLELMQKHQQLQLQKLREIVQGKDPEKTKGETE